MKKIILILAFVLVNNLVFAQILPESYKFDKKGLAKTSTSNSTTPLSNSVSDIVIVGDTIWLGTSRGLSQSNDNGETWINYYEHEAFGTESIPALSYDYSTRTIWAATMHIEDKGEGIGLIRVGTGLRYSEDGGNTWNSVAQPVDNPADSSIMYGNNELYILPITVTEQNITYDIGFTEGTVWLASWSSGLRKSTDKGETWQRVVIPPDDINSISPNETLDFRIHPRENNNHLFFSFLSTDDNTIYAGSAGGINKSTDGGISWQKFNHQNQTNPISGNWVIGLEQNLADKSIWAVTRKSDGISEIFGISSTHDEGQNWSTYLPGANGNNIGFRYYMDGNNYERGDVIFCTAEGAYRTPNNGDTWILQPEINDSQSGTPILSDSYLNAASKNISDDEAEIWLGTSGGLVKLQETSDFWKGDWKVYFVSQSIDDESSSYAFPNPFQPGLESTRIKYSTGSSGATVTIRILDFGMNLVKVLVQNVYRNQGDNNLEDYWDGRDENGNIVANGVYFYRIDRDSKDPIYGKIMVMR